MAVPGHGEAGIGLHLGNHRGLQVFPGGQGEELLGILGGHHHGHALLGFADGKLRAVQAIVLPGHFA